MYSLKINTYSFKIIMHDKSFEKNAISLQKKQTKQYINIFKDTNDINIYFHTLAKHLHTAHFLRFIQAQYQVSILVYSLLPLSFIYPGKYCMVGAEEKYPLWTSNLPILHQSWEFAHSLIAHLLICSCAHFAQIK